MTELERENYCKDCSRSIYGNNPLKCDTNIENNGKYNGSGKCYNKCNENGMVEQYPWEEKKGE